MRRPPRVLGGDVKLTARVRDYVGRSVAEHLGQRQVDVDLEAAADDEGLLVGVELEQFGYPLTRVDVGMSQAGTDTGRIVVKSHVSLLWLATAPQGDCRNTNRNREVGIDIWPLPPGVPLCMSWIW